MTSDFSIDKEPLKTQPNNVEVVSEYTVVRGIDDYNNGKRWEPGDTILSTDVSSKNITWLMSIGAITDD